AANTRWRPASVAAAASPAAPLARTTAAGGTRSGSSASTTRCASGRKTYSRRTSVTGRRLRERSRSVGAGVEDASIPVAAEDDLLQPPTVRHRAGNGLTPGGASRGLVAVVDLGDPLSAARDGRPCCYAATSSADSLSWSNRYSLSSATASVAVSPAA